MKRLMFATIVSAVMLASCGGKKDGEKNGSDSASAKLSGSITIDGSSTVYPITEAVAEEFKAIEKDVKVTAGLSGTGGGFKKFGRGETDINDASRPIKPSEDSVCKANGITYVELKVAYDGLAIVVNKDNNWCSDITVEELKKLWEPAAQGKITRWNQIRASWPNEEIHLFGAGVESGTFDYFTEAINGKEKACRGDYTASEDDNILVQGIKSDKFALGFFGLAYFEENKEALKLVGVDDLKDDTGKGPVTPTEETVKNKTYSPLGRPLFIYVNSKAAARPEVQAFVNFYLENSKTLAKDVGYVSMNDAEVNEEKSKFAEYIKTLSPNK